MEWLLHYYLFVIFVIGLIIGSFLNVVIARLPRMLNQAWTLQCYDYIQQKNPTESTQPYNLMVPRSHCPQCQQMIRAIDNIPILSFLFLKGRCRYCHTKISWRYPLTELITGLLSIAVAYRFGLTWQMPAALLLTWSLVALTQIDFNEQLLPDDIVLPMLWLGLLLNSQSLFTGLSNAVFGAVFGYLFLWGVYWLFKLVTHKEGMGYGDFKLLAMLGAWLGWQALPVIVLLSSLVGVIVGLSLIASKRLTREQPIPFGPYLAMAGWLSLMWGDKLMQLYFKSILNL
ncbi:prepilin peptidase [Candidatus Berkiella aquae]|uniref:Prepilin leader peptidase/N-methyltransferase n=1 Tax=Candidatus Berkiella aquae TaxID=295108 RepID=A0A0Q9YGS7_9GAMM|nr:A24 family peptidase [Candidatus Berkiella aquae]MCS5710827.1 A24 family peptidase [Candidatus Berkiella aquae]